MNPPARYRMITPNLTISEPLSDKSVRFLHDEGFRKVITLSGGFVSSEIVPVLKDYKMEVPHFPIDLRAPDAIKCDQITKVVAHLRSLLEKESKVHVVCGPEMIEAACIVGLTRVCHQHWNLSSALCEALEISRFVDAEVVTSTILNHDLFDRK